MQTHHVQPVTFSIFTDVRAAREEIQNWPLARAILDGKNKGLAGFIGTSFWDMGEKMLATAQEWENQKGKEAV